MIAATRIALAHRSRHHSSFTDADTSFTDADLWFTVAKYG
jgi:hypothetical protein